MFSVANLGGIGVMTSSGSFQAANAISRMDGALKKHRLSWTPFVGLPRVELGTFERPVSMARYFSSADPAMELIDFGVTVDEMTGLVSEVD
jgi:hypothetical protein